MKIMLLEDDALLADGIQTALTHFKYTVDWETKSRQCINLLTHSPYDLLILDLGLPDLDGIDALKELRDKGITLPILILTARDQVDDKIIGLNAGADDYMVKPFDIKELEARIRTLTRRTAGRRTDQLHVGNAMLDLNERILMLNNTAITFSRREFSIIRALFERPRQVFTRELLEEVSYTWNEEIESNATEVHIHRLRKKLGNKAIKTVRGVGYMLVEDHFS